MEKVRIKELREERGLSQQELSVAMGLSQQTISNYECCISEPDIALIKKLCKFFNVTSDYLLGITDY